VTSLLYSCYLYIYICVNSPLMPFIKSVEFGLVVIRIVSSAYNTNLDFLLLSSVFVFLLYH